MSKGHCSCWDISHATGTRPLGRAKTQISRPSFISVSFSARSSPASRRSLNKLIRMPFLSNSSDRDFIFDLAYTGRSKRGPFGFVLFNPRLHLSSEHYFAIAHIDMNIVRVLLGVPMEGALNLE